MATATEGDVGAEIIPSEKPVQESTTTDAVQDQDATGGGQQHNGPVTSGETANDQQTPAAPVQQQEQLLQQTQKVPQETHEKRSAPETTPVETVQQHVQLQKQTNPEPRREPEETREDSLEFSTPTLPVRSVVVFLDRAEVARTVQATIQKGEHEIILRNLSHAIDKDSIRVEGSGHAIINEVTYQSKTVSSEANDTDSGESDEVKTLKNMLKELKQEKLNLFDTLKRVNQQKIVLDQFGDGIVEQASGQHLSELVCHDALTGIEEFLKTYEEQASRLDEHKMVIEDQLQQLHKKIAKVENDLKDRKAKPQDTTEVRELSILLDAKQNGRIELHVSYVVSNARWSPKYDVRVNSESKRMQVQYFGMIQQATGEDWDDAKVSLSTAIPSVGGQAPELTSKYLSLTDSLALQKSPNKSKAFGHGFFRTPSFRRKKKARLSHAPIHAHEREVESDEEGGECLGAPSAGVIEGITSVTYEIANLTNIPADNSTHKVSVASVNLSPHFDHETVPKLAAHAFLKAKTKNDSTYAFLEGPANIFLDNNFVTKSILPPSNPSEEFECSLGVDPAVKVTYKPPHRFQEQSGFVSKTRTITFHQQIEINNTRQDDCQIKVTDQYPQSSEEKIKVRLIEPQILKAVPGQVPNPRINEANNIEWKLSVPSHHKCDLTVKYSVEYPIGQQVEGL